MTETVLPGPWTIGTGRLGNAPRPPSPTPLGWQIQQHQMVDTDGVDRWEPPEVSPLHYLDPDEACASLWERRKDRNRVRIPDGLEFDRYAASCAPSPDLAAVRVRVRYLSEKPEEGNDAR